MFICTYTYKGMFCIFGQGLNGKKFCKVTAAAQTPAPLLSREQHGPTQAGASLRERAGRGGRPRLPLPEGGSKRRKEPHGARDCRARPLWRVLAGVETSPGDRHERPATLNVGFCLSFAAEGERPTREGPGPAGLRSRGAEGPRD